jgi:hypothetical protein
VTAVLDDDLLSPDEVAPDSAKPEPKPGIVCQWCDWSIPAGTPFGFAARGRHVKKLHPEHFAGATFRNDKKPTKSASPARKAPAKPKPSPPPANGGAKPKPRKSGSETLGMIVDGAGQIVGAVDPLMGGVLAFEADAAGEAIDKACAHTVIDRAVIQPLAGGAEKWNDLGAVVSLPAMMLLIRAHPPLVVPLEKHLRTAIGRVMAASLPAVKRRVTEEKKVLDALKELKAIDPAFAEDEDPIGTILQSLLAPILQAVEEPVEAEPG